MADGFSIKMLTGDLQKEFTRIDRSVSKATMWTIRQAGRKVGQYARQQAPVYKGPARDRYFQGKNLGPMGKGDLKRSIKSSKRLKKIPGGYAITVSPRGVANIYAKQQEEHRAFMAPARSRVQGEIESIGAAAWGRATRRR